ncbi:MAG: APC family permease [Gammaproteobacteria bacterium]|nr:APC family permease [Gammaproteobacteria bacterium]
MQDNEQLVRRLGATGIWLLAVNGMIGAGIFGVPAGAAALTGIYSPLVFAACGLLLAAIVLCFAEIAGHFHGTGGPILYLQTAFGRFAGFQAGWAFYVARVTAFAANVNLLVASIAFFWPAAATGAVRIGLLATIVFGLAWINVLGVKQAMRSLGILTVLKFLPLLALVIMGLAWLEPAVFASRPAATPGMLDFGTAALLVIYAFVGWENALVPGGEARDPRRDMPRGLFWALGLVTVLYVMVQAVAVAVLPDLAESERALVDVAAVLIGPAGALLLTVGVVVSVGGNLAAAMITAPRLTYSLARQGSFPAWFGRVHPEHRTPAISVMFFAAICFALAVYGSFVWLAAMSALVRVLIYMSCIGAMPRLRQRFAVQAQARDSHHFQVPLGWTVPVLAFLVCGLLLTRIGLDSVLSTAGVLGAGAIIYWQVRRRRHD